MRNSLAEKIPPRFSPGMWRNRGQPRAAPDEDRVEASVEEFRDCVQLPDHGVEVDLDPEFLDVVDLRLDDLLWQAELGDTVHEDAPRSM